MTETATPQPVCHPLSCRCAECACIRLEGRRPGADVAIAVGRRREGVRIVAADAAHPRPKVKQSRADDSALSGVRI